MTLSEGEKKLMGLVVIPLLTIIVVTIVMFSLGYSSDLIWIIGNGSILLVFVVAVLYMVFFHSKKVWPGLSASKRFVKVITFQR
jgi:protein-S-isoprenylcysteine O-methyltransferase Ste14